MTKGGDIIELGEGKREEQEFPSHHNYDSSSASLSPHPHQDVNQDEKTHHHDRNDEDGYILTKRKQKRHHHPHDSNYGTFFLPSLSSLSFPPLCIFPSFLFSSPLPFLFFLPLHKLSQCPDLIITLRGERER